MACEIQPLANNDFPGAKVTYIDIVSAEASQYTKHRRVNRIHSSRLCLVTFFFLFCRLHPDLVEEVDGLVAHRVDVRTIDAQVHNRPLQAQTATALSGRPAHVLLQVRAGQIGSGQVGSGQVRSGRVRSGQVGSDQVRSGQGRSRQARSGQVRSSKVGSNQVRSGKVGSVRFRSAQARSGRVRSARTRISLIMSEHLKSDYSM